MKNWFNPNNKKAFAIIRRSSDGQKDNTSEETQRREILAYVAEVGLELQDCDIHPIIETGYKAEHRKKYNEIKNRYLKKGYLHFVFYISSRETRNLQDLHQNEKLIRAGKLIVHHAYEKRAYWKGSTADEFLSRNIQSVINEHESRNNADKVREAYKTKALSGVWPYRHTPLGYVHFKKKDDRGNAIKGTARLIPDPNQQNVSLVQREFELRAQGLSYDVIRDQNLASGIVPPRLRPTYNRTSIEKRMKNELYWGHFKLFGDDTEYSGNHELIIPKKILDAVKMINESNGTIRISKVNAGDDIFRGWLKCGHDSCGLNYTYEQKTKTIKSTGEEKTYHLYRCPNSRKVHEKKVYSNEDEIWRQLNPAVDRFSISESFAKDIAEALNETHRTQQSAIKKQISGFKKEQEKLEVREDEAYEHLTKGILDERGYKRQIDRIRNERRDYENQIETLTLQITDAGIATVQKVFELAINAKSLYESLSREQKLEYLKSICSNPTLDGLTLEYQLKKPFARLESWKKNREWRRG
jgi:hypothetical protein